MASFFEASAASSYAADPRATEMRLTEDERAAIKAESDALGRRWETLRGDLLELEEHKLRLEDEWRELEMERERLIADRGRFEEMVRAEWFHVADPREAARRIMRLNVGGQLFEVGAYVLCRDRFSLLAAICSDSGRSPIKPDTSGCYFFDRDWWLFRHARTKNNHAVLHTQTTKPNCQQYPDPLLLLLQ